MASLATFSVFVLPRDAIRSLERGYDLQYVVRLCVRP